MSAIAGIGTDLVKMDRIDLAWRRHPERFPEKILGVDELCVFRARAARDRARGVRYLATRFAAKEAFSKAIGLGMRMPMWWTRMQTLNAPGGRPQIVLSAPLAQWYAEGMVTPVMDKTMTVADLHAAYAQHYNRGTWLDEAAKEKALGWRLRARLAHLLQARRGLSHGARFAPALAPAPARSCAPALARCVSAHETQRVWQ